MKRIIHIAAREFIVFVSSPGSYVIVFLFLFSTSIWFYVINNFLVRNLSNFQSYFVIFPYLLIFMVPSFVIGNRGIASGKSWMEILLSFPVKTFELVLGDYLAVMLEIIILLILTIPVPLTLVSLGHFDSGRIISQYAGLLFFSSLMTSLSILVSSYSKSSGQIFMLSIFLFLLLLIPGAVVQISAVQGIFPKIFRYISPALHYGNFEKGVLDTRDLVYYIVLSFLALYFTEKKIESDKRVKW